MSDLPLQNAEEFEPKTSTNQVGNMYIKHLILKFVYRLDITIMGFVYCLFTLISCFEQQTHGKFTRSRLQFLWKTLEMRFGIMTIFFQSE